MGMHDDVVFDEDVPNMPTSARRFQTKSFDCCLDYYIVTKEGRLCMAGNTFVDDDSLQPHRSIENVDVDYHGDIRLVTSEGDDEEYIARFTHGTLEWVRPFDQSASAAMAARMRSRRG